MTLESGSLKIKTADIGIFIFILVGIVPFIAAFIYALLYSFGIAGVLNEGFTTEFWISVLKSGEFLKSFFYSAGIALISVLISVGGALWLTLKFRSNMESDYLSMVLYLPLAIPGIVASFFTFQLLSKAGFLSRVGFQLGLFDEVSDFPDLVNDTYAIGIILTFISMVLPFFLLLFLSVYKNERIDELTNLSKALGANSRQIAQKVVLPILLRKTWILIVLYFIFLLGAYEVPLILGQESPQMLSVLIIREIKQYDLTQISEGYVIAVLYTILVSLAAILLFLPGKNIRHET